MATFQDTLDTCTLSLYLEACEVLSVFRPRSFDPYTLMMYIDAAYVAGRPIRYFFFLFFFFFFFF